MVLVDWQLLLLIDSTLALLFSVWLCFSRSRLNAGTQSSSSSSRTSTAKQYVILSCCDQGCPQDVKSQDRDETETVNLQERDVLFSQTLKTEMRPRRSKKRIETTVLQFKNTNWWSLSLDNLFLACQIHYFLRDISASLMHCMDVHKTKVTRPRCYIFKMRRDRDVEPSRPRRDRDVRFFQTLETETFNLQDWDETFQKTSWDRDVQDRDYIPGAYPQQKSWLSLWLALHQSCTNLMSSTHRVVVVLWFFPSTVPQANDLIFQLLFILHRSIIIGPPSF